MLSDLGAPYNVFDLKLMTEIFSNISFVKDNVLLKET